MRHLIIFDEPGRFGGWPANNGIWIWDNEIVVGFSNCAYKEKAESHSIDKSHPTHAMLARSLDGGETWAIEEHPEFKNRESSDLEKPIDFTHPGFGLWCRGGVFRYSYNRGKTWHGPHRFPEFFEGIEMTARTDYLVNGRDDCHVFIAAKNPEVRAGIKDRAFSTRMTDGGRTIKFLGWMTGEPLSVRSVMPSTVRLSDTDLVSLVRRRYDIHSFRGFEFNWIEAEVSRDNGVTWEFLCRVATTDMGFRNGNPPSLLRLQDGRLVAGYGVRMAPEGIRAKTSESGGKSWSREIHLRDDGRTFDLGYPRMVQRPDGKIVTIYYYTTETRREQHIAATIWDPDEV